MARTFANTAPITISGGTTNPYPSTIVVSGLTNGKIVDVNLILVGFNHTYRGDVDILLAATQITGRNAIVMSDIGGEGDAATNVNLRLDDQATNQLPASGPLVSGATYRPANYSDPDPDAFPGAPTPTGNSLLSTFNGQNPNGTWQLFVVDDVATVDNGNFTGGWALDLLVEIDV